MYADDPAATRWQKFVVSHKFQMIIWEIILKIQLHHFLEAKISAKSGSQFVPIKQIDVISNEIFHLEMRSHFNYQHELTSFSPLIHTSTTTNTKNRYSV